ncbi:MAG: phosphoribosylformylglycinamidine cyclo-ligase [Candidatus Margulisiibacteriota bacterium]|nr:MAG: phosphoribosylformylglycinamidine cyclo-ligase [Candidatus Margulisiibacteriota bacterium]HCY35842.1 phosphoribosylformylglycinamidine cyclo-ligase [Candidatus Margulisiibacteriota bacterium]
MEKITYKQAGVDVEAGYEVVRRIKHFVKSTYTPGVIGEIGFFGGFFKPDFKKYNDPIMVSGTDGVGTKVKVSILLGKHDTIGIDLVAMSVNDILCCGADPLFFLDYIACNKVEPAIIADIVKGIADGCKECGCALLGGETAEMGDVYSPGDYDLAGFAVGIVDREKIIDGSKITNGQKIVGLSSSGLHSNGYSLARKVLITGNPEDDRAILEEMLTPTRLYVDVMKKFKEANITINGIANITGGGLPENVARLLPKNSNAQIKKDSWDKPAIFQKIVETGLVEEKEMYHAFNMGIGMVMIIPEDEISRIPEGFVIGEIIPGDQVVEII